VLRSSRACVQSSGVLYPVPVRITDLSAEGKRPNQHPESQSWKDDIFVRRFHLFDPEVGKADTSVVGDSGELVPRFLRVATEIELRITTRQDKPDHIYIPILTLTFNDIAVPATSSPAVDDISVKFSVSVATSCR